MRSQYAVTTMGAIVPFPPDDDVESGMLNQQFTMQALGAAGDELPLAASETGEVIIEQPGISTHAILNQIPGPFDAIVETLTPAGGGGGLFSKPKPKTGGGGGGGGSSGGGLLPTGGNVGIFGDLFGENTDTIVIGLGIVVAAGLGWMLVSKKRKGKR